VSRVGLDRAIGPIERNDAVSSTTMWDTRLVDILPPGESAFYGGDFLDQKVTIRDILAHRMALPRNDGGWLLGTTRSRSDIWK
jgi:hypothetical protein